MVANVNLTSNNRGDKKGSSRLVYILLAIAIAINAYSAFTRFSSTALDFDASHYYIPYAQQLLSENFRFFTEEKSLRYPPMAYVYPALLGANQIAVKLFNIFLSCIIVLLLYRTGKSLHSSQAGLCAGFLFALSPQFHDLIPRVLTEPVFFFLTAGWLWCVTEIFLAKKYWLALPGSIFFGLAILTRGSIYYFAFAVIVAASGMLLRTRGESRRTWQNILLMHFVALLFPLVFIIKNWLLFDFPFFATGAGNALYFGSHPLVNGYELPYYGLGYDEGAISGEHDHLSVVGDRLLKGVALTMLSDRPWLDLLAAYLQKTGAFIFVSKAVLTDSIWNFRTLRIVEITLSTIGLASVKSRPMQVFIGGLIAYQIAIHVPVLYSHRYSVGALDLWLVLLSGIGVAALIKSHNLRQILFTASLILTAVAAGEFHRKYSAPLSPDIANVPHQVIWRRLGKDLAPSANIGFTPTGPGDFRLAGEPNALDIPVRGVSQLDQTGNYVLSLKLSIKADDETSCKKFRVLYKRLVDSGFSDNQSSRIRIQKMGQMLTYDIGATLPLALISDGDLRLTFECPAGTLVAIDNISIAEPTVAKDYKQLYLNHLNKEVKP